MVLEIRLENFFSINEEVVLDMRAARIQTKKAVELEGNTFVCNNERMLKSVAVYGANASGKSNVIKAIRACVQMIFESHNYNENTVFGFMPFKFGGVGKPSRFLIRFLLDGIEYEYSFFITRMAVAHWCLPVTKGKDPKRKTSTNSVQPSRGLWMWPPTLPRKRCLSRVPARWIGKSRKKCFSILWSGSF